MCAEWATQRLQEVEAKSPEHFRRVTMAEYRAGRPRPSYPRISK
jgi:hypothetical protein